jgi:hypothetical protein
MKWRVVILIVSVVIGYNLYDDFDPGMSSVARIFHLMVFVGFICCWASSTCQDTSD